MGKTAFVTVGTTLFESLIETVTTNFALVQLSENGYTRLVIQYGKGNRPQIPNEVPLTIECYDFKPTLRQDMEAADLILSHAGAGTLMEATALKKGPVIVAVINTVLMDNHQTELAYALQETGCLCVVAEAKLFLQVDTWQRITNFAPKYFPKGDQSDFPRILNRFFGFNKED